MLPWKQLFLNFREPWGSGFSVQMFSFFSDFWFPIEALPTLLSSGMCMEKTGSVSDKPCICPQKMQLGHGYIYIYILQGICPFSQLSLPATGGDVGWEGSSGIPFGWLSSWDEDQNLALACVRFGMSAKHYVVLSR